MNTWSSNCIPRVGTRCIDPSVKAIFAPSWSGSVSEAILDHSLNNAATFPGAQSFASMTGGELTGDGSGCFIAKSYFNT